MPTSETQRRISDRQAKLLGEIGVLDWHIKQLTAQQEQKYREIEAMLREQPFIQQLELDLIDKYRDHQQQRSNSVQPDLTGANSISQSETLASPEQMVSRAEDLEDAARVAKGRKKTPAKRLARKAPAAAAKPKVAKPTAAKSAPIEAVATTPPKRGRGRPRKQAVAAPPPVATTPAQAGNGANDLDAAFGAM